MAILIKNRDQYSVDRINKEIDRFNILQDAVFDEIKSSLDTLISIDYLYDIRDYIDQLITDWESIEIALEDLDE